MDRYFRDGVPVLTAEFPVLILYFVKFSISSHLDGVWYPFRMNFLFLLQLSIFRFDSTFLKFCIFVVEFCLRALESAHFLIALVQDRLFPLAQVFTWRRQKIFDNVKVKDGRSAVGLPCSAHFEELFKI